MQHLVESIKKAIEETLPKTEQIKKKWISKETLELIQQKRLFKLKRDESKEADTRYKKSCNDVKAAVREDKKRWINAQCDNIEKYYGEFKIREAYQLVRGLNRKWQPKLSIIRDKNGKTLMGKEEINARWTEYCSELYSETDIIGAEDYIKELERIAPPPHDDVGDNILRHEVETAIQKLKRNKSPGEDGITAEMVKAGGDVLVQEIHSLCKQAWEEGRVPNEWLKSVLIPIPKKGNVTECKNYRTISLLSHIGKIFMIVLQRKLDAQLEPHMSDEQAGFRKDRNTVQQF